MNRTHLKGALLVAAATLLTTGAYAQSPNAAPQGKANAADKADKAADKTDKAAEKADKAADKVADKADKLGAKVADKEDRAARKTKEHDAQREKLRATLKGPVDDALKQELRRHAERVARLDRIKAVAQTEKDTASAEKAATLIGKENDRHDKWMAKHVAGTTAATPPGATPTPVADTKGGAK